MQPKTEDATPILPEGASLLVTLDPAWLRRFFASAWELQETGNFHLFVVAMPKAFARDYLAALRDAGQGVPAAFETDAHHGEIVRGVIDGAAALAKAQIDDA